MTALPRYKVLLFALAATVLAGASGAADEDAGRLFGQLDADGDGQIVAAEISEDQRLLFKRLVRTGDADGDGRLSSEELAAALQPVRAEKTLVEKQGSRLPGADALTVLLAKMDVNGDQRIEADEAPEAYRPAFEQMLRPGDGDKDGALDAREIGRAAPRLGIIAQMAARRLGLDVPAEMAKLPAEQANATDRMDAYGRPAEMMADPAQAQELFKRFDADGDNYLTAEEAPGPFAERFAEMVQRGDGDRDGRLSKQEFLAMSRRLAEFESAEADPAAVRRALNQLLRRFDDNGDGELSVREAPPRIAENFARSDGDANGRLDRTELTRVAGTIARMQSFAQEPGFGPPGMAPDDGDEPPRKKPQKKARKPRTE